MDIREFVGDNKAMSIMFHRELMGGGARPVREVIDECIDRILDPRTLVNTVN